MMYTYLAYEVVTGDPIDEIPFTTFEWSDELGRPGGFRATIAVTHPKALRANFGKWQTTIWVDRGGTLMYGGVVTATQVRGETLTVSGLGFWGYYDRRRIRSGAGMDYAVGYGSEIRWSQVDQFDIVADIIGHAHAAGAGDPFGLSIEMRGPEVGGLSGVLRDRSVWRYERKQIADMVEQLAAVNNGFDFSISYAWNSGSPSAVLNLWYPRRGRSLDLVFEQPKNITLLDYAENGANQANVVTAFGAGDGDAMLTVDSSDPNLLAPAGPYPLLEDVVSYRDVVHESTLAGHATARRARVQHPTETARVELRADTDTELGAFEPGDDVMLVAQYGYLDIAARFRIQSVSVKVDEAGSETIGADLASLDASLGLE